MKVEKYLINKLRNNNYNQDAILDITKFILASIFDTSIIDIQDLAETLLNKEMNM